MDLTIRIVNQDGQLFDFRGEEITVFLIAYMEVTAI